MRRLVVVLAVLLAGCASEGPAAEDPVWSPTPGTAWQWQLGGLPLDTTVDVPVFDVDLFETSADEVDTLRGKGRRLICYVSVGSWEPYRPDAAAFPEDLLGNPLDGFPDERWLDIRAIDRLRPLVEARLDECRASGFDAVEPDNVDGYANDTGFPLTAADQLSFNRFVADAAHERGMSVGLKNDVEQIDDLVDDFDWALNEQCVQFDECDRYEPFVDAGKAVLHVEYEVPLREACTVTAGITGFSTMVKDLDLTAERASCDQADR